VPIREDSPEYLLATMTSEQIGDLLRTLQENRFAAGWRRHNRRHSWHGRIFDPVDLRVIDACCAQYEKAGGREMPLTGQQLAWLKSYEQRLAHDASYRLEHGGQR
jgi:hypothetical protein